MATSTTWQPQEAGLMQLCNLLTISQKGENQAQVLQQLDAYRAYPDFNNYLTCIFAQAEQIPVEVRQSAGLYLKNTLRQNYDKTAKEYKDYMKDALGRMLAHPEKALRHTAGSCVCAMVVVSGLSDWQALTGLLHACLVSSDAAAVDGGLDALYKIVEESPIQMETTIPQPGSPTPTPAAGPGGPTTTTNTSTVLVPPLIKLLQSPTANVRKLATAVLNLMAGNMPAGIVNNFDGYLHSLFALANDTSFDVRKEVVRGLVQLLAIQPDRLEHFMHQIVEYMIQCNETDDEGVALESCEFWLAFCDANMEDTDLLRPFLPRLIPILLKNMVFDEYDEEVQDAQAAERVVADTERDSDLKPMHHRSGRGHGGEPNDDDDDETTAHWNLRKCSAAGLDRLSVMYGVQLLPVIMPIVEQRLQEADWRSRESAILALGAVAEGCHLGLLPHLASMVDMLLPKLQDAQPMVRIISCWALGRYSFWLLTGAQESAAAAAAGQQAQNPSANLHIKLGQVIQGLLQCVLDRNKFVQESAASSVALLCQTAGEEDAGHMLSPQLPALVQVISQAVKTYGKRNLHLACDALCMLGEAVGPALRDASLCNLFMPAVVERLSTLQPTDKQLIPLMEAAIMAAGALGPNMDPWLPTIWNAAMSIATTQASLQATAIAHRAAGVEPTGKQKHPEYDSDLHALALDTISGLAESLGQGLEPMITSSPLVQLIVSACEHGGPDVKQSGFALVGDLSRSCVHHLIPVVPQLVAAAVHQLSPGMIQDDTLRACNNACWSLGELSIKLQPEAMAAWAGQTAERMAGLLSAGPQALPGSLIENAAITLGRIAWRAPQLLAPHLAHFCVPWCLALRSVRDDVEKEQAFQGLIALLALNPDAVTVPGQPFMSFASAATSWRGLPSSSPLGQQLQQALQALKSRMQQAGSWQAAVQQLQPQVAQKLGTMVALQ